MSNLDWNLFKEKLQGSRRILVSAHVRLDGDALGSEMTLAHALRSLGYETTVMNPDAPPEAFRFIGADFDKIRVYSYVQPDMSREEAESYDTIIVVDTSSTPQLKAVADLIKSGKFKVLIVDHHSTAETLTPDTFADSTAPAAGCLVMELVKTLGVPLAWRPEGSSFSLAEYLYFAIATDTGWFRFSSTLPDTFRQAGELVALGASTSQLYDYAYQNYAPARLQLLGLVATRSSFMCGNRVAYSWLTLDDFERTNARPFDSSDLVNILQITAGVEVVILFTEMVEDGRRVVRMNFRSRSEFDVGKFARLFGGGGHKGASGATLEGDLSEIRERVLGELRTFS